MGAQNKSGRSGTRGYAHLIEVQAPVSRVWRALTDASLIQIWQNTEAQVDARQGGLFRTGKSPGPVREAHIDIFEPSRRLRLIYLNGRDFPPSDSAIVDDFLLDVKNGKIAVRLLGSGIPDAQVWDRPYVKLRLGWERLLARLRVTLESPPKPQDPKADSVDPPLTGLDF